MSRRMMTKPQRNKQTPLPAGVYRHVKRRTLRSGAEAEYLYYSTHTVENGKSRVKSFSCGPIPVSRALEQTRKAEAIAYRLNWEASVHTQALGMGRGA